MSEWSHSSIYHSFLLRTLPLRCGRGLDVGCGEGLLVRELSARCDEVLGLDLELHTDGKAWPANVHIITGDVLTYPFGPASFDVVTAVAVLHHLPLRAGLERLRDLVVPGGVLIVVGLYRAEGLVDAAWSALGMAASLALRCFRGQQRMGARMAEPRESLATIRTAARQLLPGAEMKRRLLFRYTVVWRRAV